MSTDASPASAEGCPLPAALQRRNSLCYGGFWCLFYFAAPVTYVGTTHANLLHELGCSDTWANLPHAIYQWFTACPILVAWLLPQPRVLRPLIVGSLCAMAAVTAAVAVALAVGASSSIVTGCVLLFAAVFGASNGTLVTAMWEVVRRGTSAELRGRTMALAFGVGPIFACLGSVLQQLLMGTEPLTGWTFGLGFPHNYLSLFGGAVPIVVCAALLGTLFVVPRTEETAADSLVGNAVYGLRQFFTYPPVFIAAVAYLIVYSGGNAIFENVSLHARDVLGDRLQDTQGIQNFLRFSFKSAAGFLLGWLLTRTHPKATLLATTGTLLFAMGWVLNSSGNWYLISAGLLGAGELFGAYFPNYVVTASSKSTVRANVACLNLLGSFVGFASVFFGWLADTSGRIATFYAASIMLVVALGIIIFGLPSRPVPAPERQESPGVAP